MVTRNSSLVVCDQSGVKEVKCIGFLKSIFARSVGLNEVIRVCIKKFDRRKFFVHNATSKKGKSAVMARAVSKEMAKYDRKKKRGVAEPEVLLYLAVIISSAKKWYRRDGTFLCTHRNRVVFLDNTYKLRSAHITGPVNKELRFKRRLVAFAKSIYSNAGRRI